MIVHLLYLIPFAIVSETLAFSVVAPVGRSKCGSCMKISCGPSLVSMSATEGEQDGDGSLNNNSDNIESDDDDMPIIATSTVKIDDGGSDLTDRFKYKVNALMGKYDPVQAETDNETNDGNILQAMLKFPTPYAFNVVGRTNGDDEMSREYSEKVHQTVSDISGDLELQSHVFPRGKNFTKVTTEAVVESASMITLIYDKLDELDCTIMRF